MQVVVGRVGRAHGVRGDVSVDVRTDEPELRFFPGALLQTDPLTLGPLVVSAVRQHSGRTLVRFEQVSDRTGAESLRGAKLLVDVDPERGPSQPGGESDQDEYYDRQLVGLEVVDATLGYVGRVVEVVHLPGQELLAVERADDRPQVLVPFVSAIVTEVDLAERRVLVELPGGLLELADE